MKLKGIHFADVAEIQVAVTDELKKVRKEEFSAAFQKLYDREKACIYANAPSIYKQTNKQTNKQKSILKLFDRTAFTGRVLSMHDT
jgi:hypothetical protein